MKNLLVFLAMAVVAMPFVARLNSINRSDFRFFMENYIVGLLTAAVMYATLTVIAVLL